MKNVSNFSLNVSTEKMSSKAETIKGICVDIVSHINSISKEVDLCKNYWNSDSSDLLVSLFKDESEEMKTISSCFNYQIDNLNKIINVYKTTESHIFDEVSGLPSKLLE